MDIPQGYKQTELGVIPDDWDVKKLGEIAIVSSGGTPNRSNPFYWNGNIPWITTSQIDFNTIIYSNEFITELGLQNSAAKLYAQNTLLMAMYGQGKTRGKVAILGIDATINQACAAISLNKDVSNDYVLFYLAHNYEEIRKLSNTGNQENLNGNIIKSIFVPLPPLAEQKAIAQSLSDVDALITAIDKLITKKRNIKQGAMQELLTGKKRLPGFTGDRDVKKLGDIFEFKNGLNKEKKFFGIGTPIVNYMDVYKNRGLTAKDLKGRVTVTDKEIKTYEVRKGDVFFTRTSETVDEIGISSVMIEDLANTVFSGFVLRARPKNNWMSNSYKKYCFSSYSVRSEIISKSSYTTRALTNGKLLSNVNIFIPPTKEEQKAIAQILSDMDAEIEGLEKNREKYKLIKRGIMQELLTGKTRLKHQLDPLKNTPN